MKLLPCLLNVSKWLKLNVWRNKIIIKKPFFCLLHTSFIFFFLSPLYASLLLHHDEQVKKTALMCFESNFVIHLLWRLYHHETSRGWLRTPSKHQPVIALLLRCLANYAQLCVHNITHYFDCRKKGYVIIICGDEKISYTFSLSSDQMCVL